jgi:hypothetical protein
VGTGVLEAVAEAYEVVVELNVHLAPVVLVGGPVLFVGVAFIFKPLPRFAELLVLVEAFDDLIEVGVNK